MKKKILSIMFTAALVVALGVATTTPVYAGEDEEGYSESSSDFEEQSSEPESSDSSSESAGEPSSEPAAPAPAAEEATPAAEPAAPAAPVSTGDSTESGSSGSSTPTDFAPWVAPTVDIVTPVVTTPVVTENVTEVKAAPQAKKAAVNKEVVTRYYEPPYVTEKSDGEELELESGELSDRKAPEATTSENEASPNTEEPKSTFPWWAIVAGIAVLATILFGFFYRPYKVVKKSESDKDDEEKSFFGIKGAAKFAASLLDSKDFEKEFDSLVIVKKNDDKGEDAEKIDREIFETCSDGSSRTIGKATEKELAALKECKLWTGSRPNSASEEKLRAKKAAKWDEQKKSKKAA